MALSATTLYFDLIARDKASAAFLRAGGAADTASAKIQRAGAKMSVVGGKLTRSITLPVAAVGAVSVKMAADFDASMQKINGLVGISQKQIGHWSDDILAMAKTLPASPRELADALYYITSDGLRGAVALDTLKKSAMASAAGLGDTATVAETVTSAINAYGHKALDASKATDIMVAAVRAGKLNAADLAPVLGRVIPIASEMGVSFDQVTAAIASMSRTGQSAQNAATSVQAVLSGLLKPSAAGAKALHSVGLSFAGLRHEVANKGLFQTLMTVKTAFHGNDAAIAKVIPNVRALRGFLALTGRQAGTTGKIFHSTANSTGLMNKAFESASRTASFKFKSALSSLQVAMIDLGNKLLPAVTKGVNVLVGALDWFSGQPNWFKELAGGAVLFLAALGPVLSIGGNLVKFGLAVWKIAKFLKIVTAVQWLWNAALDANPIGLIILGLVALGVGLVIAYKKSKTFRDIVNGAFHAVATVAKKVFGWVVSAASKTFDFIKSHWKLIASILGGPFVAAVIVIASNWGKIKAGTSAVVGFIRDRFNSLVDFIYGIPGRLAHLAGNFLSAGRSLGSSILTGMVNGMKAVSGFLGSLIGAVKSAINSALHLPLVISIDKGPFHLHQTVIPALAKGGIVSSPTVALIGEAGPEAVVPLSSAGGFPGGGGDTYNVYVSGAVGSPQAVARMIHTELLKLKRERGSAALGLA